MTVLASTTLTPSHAHSPTYLHITQKKLTDLMFSVLLHVLVHVHVQVHAHVCMFLYNIIRVHVHMYMYMYICTCTCTCMSSICTTYMYMYVYIHNVSGSVDRAPEWYAECCGVESHLRQFIFCLKKKRAVFMCCCFALPCLYDKIYTCTYTCIFLQMSTSGRVCPCGGYRTQGSRSLKSTCTVPLSLSELKKSPRWMGTLRCILYLYRYTLRVQYMYMYSIRQEKCTLC